MDDEWTGLGLYRALHRTSHSPHGTHELSAAATSTSPESQATCWHLCSVTIFKPLFPHSMLPSTTLHRLSALRRIYLRPLYVPSEGITLSRPRRLILGHQLTGKALHTLITIAPF
jgi:hypothetical protein